MQQGCGQIALAAKEFYKIIKPIARHLLTDAEAPGHYTQQLSTQIVAPQLGIRCVYENMPCALQTALQFRQQQKTVYKCPDGQQPL